MHLRAGVSGSECACSSAGFRAASHDESEFGLYPSWRSTVPRKRPPARPLPTKWYESQRSVRVVARSGARERYRVTARDAFKSVANEEHGYGAPIPAKSKAALPAIFANHLSTRRFNIRKTMRSTNRATVKLATILTPRVITTDTSGERSTAVDTWFLRLSKVSQWLGKCLSR